jgi:hypothetical protein
MPKTEHPNSTNLNSKEEKKEDEDGEEHEEHEAEDKGKTVQKEARKDLEKVTDHIEEKEVDSSKLTSVSLWKKYIGSGNGI